MESGCFASATAPGGCFTDSQTSRTVPQSDVGRFPSLLQPLSWLCPIPACDGSKASFPERAPPTLQRAQSLPHSCSISLKLDFVGGSPRGLGAFCFSRGDEGAIILPIAAGRARLRAVVASRAEYSYGAGKPRDKNTRGREGRWGRAGGLPGRPICRRGQTGLRRDVR